MSRKIVPVDFDLYSPRGKLILYYFDLDRYRAAGNYCCASSESIPSMLLPVTSS
jgi:hypothetical protein